MLCIKIYFVLSYSDPQRPVSWLILIGKLRKLLLKYCACSLSPLESVLQETPCTLLRAMVAVFDQAPSLYYSDLQETVQWLDPIILPILGVVTDFLDFLLFRFTRNGAMAGPHRQSMELRLLSSIQYIFLLIQIYKERCHGWTSSITHGAATVVSNGCGERLIGLSGTAKGEKMSSTLASPGP